LAEEAAIRRSTPPNISSAAAADRSALRRRGCLFHKSNDKLRPDQPGQRRRQTIARPTDMPDLPGGGSICMGTPGPAAEQIVCSPTG